MRFVREAVIPPHKCAVLPHIHGHHELGYIDPGQDLNGVDPRPYVSILAVKEIARKFPVETGLVNRDELIAAQDELQGALERVASLERERDDLKEAFDAIDVIASQGFVTRKKPGRPAREKVA